MSADTVPITFKTPEEINEWLQKGADANHRSKAGQINFILENAKKAEETATE